MEISLNLLKYGKVFSALLLLSLNMHRCVTAPLKAYESPELLNNEGQKNIYNQSVGFSIVQTGMIPSGPLEIEVIAKKIGEETLYRFSGFIKDSHKKKSALIIPMEVGDWSFQKITIQIPKSLVGKTDYPGQRIPLEKLESIQLIKLSRESYVYLGEIKVVSYKSKNPLNSSESMIQTNLTYAPFAPFSDVVWNQWHNYLNSKSRFVLNSRDQQTKIRPLQKIINQKTFQVIQNSKQQSSNNLIAALSQAKGYLFFEDLETSHIYRVDPIQLKSKNYLYLVDLGSSQKGKLIGFCPLVGKTTTGGSDIREQCWLETAIPIKNSGSIQNSTPLTSDTIRMIGFLQYNFSQSPKLTFSILKEDLDYIKNQIPNKDIRSIVLNSKIRTKEIGKFSWVDSTGAQIKGLDRVSAKILIDFRSVVQECAMTLWNTDPLSTTQFTLWIGEKEKKLFVEPSLSKVLDGAGLQLFGNCLSKYLSKINLLGNETIIKGFGIEFAP